MTTEIVMFLAGQLIAILLAIGASYVKTREQLVELRTRLTSLEIHYDQGMTILRQDQSALSGRVDGISRAVARLEGAVHPAGSHIASSTKT